MEKKKWLLTDYPEIIFEDNEVGRLKKQLWDASKEDIEKILKDYDIPSESELGKGYTYIQTTPRAVAIEKRKKNDIVFIPIGVSENHGMHNNTGLDTYMCTQLVEGVRRYTAKQGHETNICLPPLNMGNHPHHHLGMPGTMIFPPEVVQEALIYTMLGLWDDGYRKMVFVNNHGHLWTLVSAIQEFMKRFQLPAVVRVIDWHRAVREFFFVTDRDDSLETNFIHAAEAETSVAQLLFPWMIDMKYVQDSTPERLMEDGHFDLSVDPYRRPSRWSEGEGHIAIERYATPEGVVGTPSKAHVDKAKRPIAAILSYLTQVHDHIREAFPPGTTPDPAKVTLRDPKDVEPFCREPMSPGWKSVHELPKIGIWDKA
ncbi:MAG: 3-dehydro-scyllo-inosose hydrolase [Alkalispirochaeta sp.]